MITSNHTAGAPKTLKLTAEVLAKLPTCPQNLDSYLGQDETHERLSLGMQAARQAAGEDFKDWELQWKEASSH